jgi:fructokinase
MKGPIFGGIEAGGTKFVCAVGSGPDRILAEIRFPTTSVEATLGKTIEFFREQEKLHGKISAVGIAAFGPIDLDPGSPTFGYITSTPKPGWRQADILGPIGKALSLPLGFDTDVNGAALGEHRWGAAQGLDTFVYLTIGTGIGGGGMLGGKLMHGMLHPEMGHVRLPHDLQTDPFPGVCPYHGDCFEGLATGPAMAARWGQPAETLPPQHPAWELEAGYLAVAVANLVCTLSPQRIILGGGVMKQAFLFPLIRSKVQSLLNDYVYTPQVLEKIDEYIVPPRLGSRAGVLGAIALAESAIQ